MPWLCYLSNVNRVNSRLKKSCVQNEGTCVSEKRCAYNANVKRDLNLVDILNWKSGQSKYNFYNSEKEAYLTKLFKPARSASWNYFDIMTWKRSILKTFCMGSWWGYTSKSISTSAKRKQFCFCIVQPKYRDITDCFHQTRKEDTYFINQLMRARTRAENCW